MAKFIIVTGGVCSSLGKGLASASIGRLLESRNLSICLIKIDPYINVDAGTMNPFQHGEVYVTDDGAETDLDLGHYARFTSSQLTQDNSITTGQIYQDVITREREGRYLGRTVQVVPHITDHIKYRILRCAETQKCDVAIIEIGGTVGDIESYPFLEAVRQMRHEMSNEDLISVHLVLLPELANREFKTKPTQHSVRELRAVGIHPDILLCRASRMLAEGERKKLALFTSVDFEAVISAADITDTLYEIPLGYHAQDLDAIILQKLNIKKAEAHLTEWQNMVSIIKESKNNPLHIALLGKYTDQNDTYLSVEHALQHACAAQQVHLHLHKIQAESLRDEEGSFFNRFSGIILPGGFGTRGVEEMLTAISSIRLSSVPYLGLCMGMQLMVIEYARNVLGLGEAHSSEFDPESPHPVVGLLEEQMNITSYGGTMRRGREKIKIHSSSKMASIYDKDIIFERHRHRYEVSNHYRSQLEKAGLIVAAETDDSHLVEAMEWKDHPWGIGVQFHPEFQSKPLKPHPLFFHFIEEAKKYQSTKKIKA